MARLANQNNDWRRIIPAQRKKNHDSYRNAQHAIIQTKRRKEAEAREPVRCGSCGGPVDGMAIFCASCLGVGLNVR